MASDIDRRQFGGRSILRERAACTEGENGTGEKDRAMPLGGCDGGRHGSDLGMTSVARHSEPGPTIAHESVGEANVCTPRPTSSRVTTADGRSPGSRVVTLHRLPRTEISQWHMTKDSPLTVAGAATALGISPRTAFPFDPPNGEPSRSSRIAAEGESIGAAVRYAFCSRRLVPGTNHCE